MAPAPARRTLGLLAALALAATKADALCKDAECKPPAGSGLLGSGNPTATQPGDAATTVPEGGKAAVRSVAVGEAGTGVAGMLVVTGEGFAYGEGALTKYRCCFSVDRDCYHKPNAYVISATELHCSLPRPESHGMHGYTVRIEAEEHNGADVSFIDVPFGVEWNGHKGRVVTKEELKQDMHHPAGLDHEEQVAVGITVAFAAICVVAVVVFLRIYRNKRTTAAMRKFFHNLDDDMENGVVEEEMGRLEKKPNNVSRNAAYET